MHLSRACVALVLVSACARSGSDQTLHSSANGTSYALRYPQLLAAARQALADDQKRAHELNVGLAKVNELKLGDPVLLRRAVDEADAAGTTESYDRARGAERDVVQLWSEERAGLGARTSAALQKELDGGCGEKDLGPTVQHALKDGLDKPLERRLRANNEAQRTLELHKARLAPGTLPAWQRAADDIALANHYAYVALPADARAVQRLLDEQSSAQATLERAIDDERKIQAEPHAGEQKASQDRVIEIEKVRATVAPEVEQARKANDAAPALVQAAQDEYSAALKTIRARLESAPAAEPTKVVTNPTASNTH
ncbi:MAG: hypothetical protein ABW352_22300 [Polyangiales bacterium]